MRVICMDISIGRRARYGISSAGTCSTTEQSHKCFTVGRCTGATLNYSTLVTGRRLLHVGDVEFCPDSGYRLGSACNGILSVIPLIAAFIFLQPFWQSGLTAGGVKE